MNLNTQFTIQDLEDRIEELESELSELLEAHDSSDLEEDEALEVTRQMAALRDESEELEELLELRKFRDDNEGYEEFIAEDYFVTYITELIDDCYELPKEMQSGEWPYNHVKIDYEAAADEARQDYVQVTLFGKEYLAR